MSRSGTPTPAAPALPSLEPAPGEAWSVGHTRPRCEKKFADLLRAERIEHYLPLVVSVRRYGDRRKTFRKPLFPGYVFLRYRPQLRTRLFQQELIARLIEVPDEARLLRQLSDVARVLESGCEATVHPLLKRGTPVRLTGGPLRGLEGVVEDEQQPSGVIIAVDVLRQGLLVQVAREDIKVLAR